MIRNFLSETRCFHSHFLGFSFFLLSYLIIFFSSIGNTHTHTHTYTMRLFARRSSLTSAAADDDDDTMGHYVDSIPVKPTRTTAPPRPLLSRAMAWSSLRRLSNNNNNKRTTREASDSFSTLNDSWCQQSITTHSSPQSSVCRSVQFDDNDIEYYDSSYVIFDDKKDNERSLAENDIDNDDDDDNNDQEQQANKDDYHQDDATTVIIMAVNQTSLWYTQQDTRKFRKQAHLDGHCLLRVALLSSSSASSSHGSSSREADVIAQWSDGLWKAFLQLDQADTVDQMQAVMHASQVVPTPAACLGLEKWAIPALHRARTHQRQALWCASTTTRAVRRWQSMPASSARQLRRLVRPHTRTARLFAVYMGRSVEQQPIFERLLK